jgi:hypothetical protein
VASKPGSGIEAGRECNERVRSQQLSLLHHRESDYSNALERRFYVLAAQAASTSNERSPESIIAARSSAISVARNVALKRDVFR